MEREACLILKAFLNLLFMLITFAMHGLALTAVSAGFSLWQLLSGQNGL